MSIELQSKKTDQVTEALRSTLNRFDEHTDDLKLQCAEASLEGELPRVVELVESIREAIRFRAEVMNLQNRWLEGRKVATSVPNAPARSQSIHRAGSTKLRVLIAGKTIEKSRAAETFVASLSELGLDRVANLGIRVSGAPLVSRQTALSYQSQSRVGDFYVTTHSNTKYKKQVLENVASKLGVPVRAEIVRA